MAKDKALLCIVIGLPLSFLINFSTCYFLSVKYNHVDSLLPFISETGNYPPESCVFSTLNSCTALLFFMTVWFRYNFHKQCLKLQAIKDSYFWKYVNKIGYDIGIVASICLFLTGNIQEANILTLHGIVAGTFFTASTIVMQMQSFLSSAISITCSKSVAKFRMMQAHLQAILITITSIFSTVYYVGGKQNWFLREYSKVAHDIAAIGEILAVLNLMIYSLTFINDTGKCSIQYPEVEDDATKFGYHSDQVMLANSEYNHI